MVWTLRKKPSAIPRVRKLEPTKPLKPLKPLQPMRPLKPTAPLGHEYYWKEDK